MTRPNLCISLFPRCPNYGTKSRDAFLAEMIEEREENFSKRPTVGGVVVHNAAVKICYDSSAKYLRMVDCLGFQITPWASWI